MANETSYPNYSVYMVEAGQLKIPYRASKRVLLYDLDEARHAAVHATIRYKQQSVIMEYSAPYKAKIVEIVNY